MNVEPLKLSRWKTSKTHGTEMFQKKQLLALSFEVVLTEAETLSQ